MNITLEMRRKKLIADKIRTRRLARGWTQRKLAITADVSESQVSRWESANVASAPGVQSLRKLSMAFGCPIDDLDPSPEELGLTPDLNAAQKSQ